MTLDNNNIKSTIKIVDSSGNPLDTTQGLKQLELMGYRLNEERHKLDMKNVIDDVAMDDIVLMIKRSNIGINIIVHMMLGKIPSDDRNGRYYFFYNSTHKYGTIEILKDFIHKIGEETKKYSMEIKDNKESLFIFESLNAVINSHIPYRTIDSNTVDAICKYLDKKRPLQFETGSVEKAIHFLINLDSKIINIKKDVYYILYMPTKTRRAINPDAINISIIKDRQISDVEFTEELKTFIRDYERDKAENEIKNKVDSIQRNIEPGIINSYDAWKSQKINLSSEIRKRLAENLYKTVNKFAVDIESERILYGMSDSETHRDNNMQFKVSNVRIGIQRWFINLILLFLVLSIGFISGIYVESKGIDIPFIHNVITLTPEEQTVTTGDNATSASTSSTPIPEVVPTETTSTPTPSTTIPEVVPTKTSTNSNAASDTSN